MGAWAMLAGATPVVAQANNITWLNTATVLAYPGHYLFNAGANWVGGVAPTNADTAVFGATTTPNLSVDVTNPNTYSTVGGFTFLAGAPAYTFSVTNGNYLQFFGAGIINGSGLTVTTGNGTATQFYYSSSAGAAHFTNASSAYLQFYNTSDAGTSTIANNSSGGTTFYASSTAANATITNNVGGLLFFFDLSSAGSSTINNSGYVNYYNTAGSDPTKELNRIVNTSTGAVDISNSSASNVYIGSIAGGGSITLGSNNLGVGGNNDSTTFDGVISGIGGSLEKIGTGTLTLTAHNTFTGNTTVSGGTLLSTNWLSSTTNFVNSGGTLGGTGFFTANNTFVYAGGTLAPGTPSAMGDMQFQSNVAFSPGSFYRVKIDSASADHVQAGIATLNGVVKVKPVGVITQTTTYNIFSSAFGYGGTTFSSAVIDGAPLARNPTLSYSGGNVYLTVDAGLLSYIIPASSTTNQKNVAAAIDNALIGGAALPPGFQSLFNLVGPQLYAGINQVSGQSASGATQTSSDAMNGLMNALFDSFLQGRAGGSGAPGSAFAAEDNDEAMAYLPRRKFTKRERDARAAVRPVRNNVYDPRWSVWGTAYGGASRTSGNAATGSSETTSNAFGFVTGADYNLTRNTTVGFAIGGGGSNYGVAGNLGSGRADMFQLGLFARHSMGAAYVTAGLGYTFQNVTTDRTVNIAGNDQLQAKFNANTFSGRIEGGYRLATPVVGISPYAALQVTHVSLPSYGETAISGNNTFALNYAAQDTTIVRTELGARFDRSYAMQSAMLTLRGRAAWAHDEGNNRRVSAVFGSLPGSNFTVNGAVPSKDLALVSAGAEVAWLNNVSLAGTFEGQFSNTTTGYGGKGTARYTW